MSNESDELFYLMSLTQVEGVGPIQAKKMLEFFKSAEIIFKSSTQDLSQVDGIGLQLARQIKNFHSFDKIERELTLIEKNNIKCIDYSHPHYPKKLKESSDHPMILFYKGEASLNYEKTISIVGTRNNTDYGRNMTERIVEELTNKNVLVVSGLALGIDTIAHKAALKNNLHSLGIIAHGFSCIYPPANKKLYEELIQKGGILTEFFFHTPPDKFNFPRRNRIVAAISDLTVVIETDIKGGSMITANFAFENNRTVFALPGKITDAKSRGCIRLIKDNKAVIFSSTEDLLFEMGWDNENKTTNNKSALKQASLFNISLSSDEELILTIIASNDKISKESLSEQSGFTLGALASILLNLELNQLIEILPGYYYRAL